MYTRFVPFALASVLSLSALAGEAGVKKATTASPKKEVTKQSAPADEASVKKAVEGKLERAVSSVTKTPYLGLYEVYVDGQIVYTDETV